jgi:DNA excision repair protein ERCC-4
MCLAQGGCLLVTSRILIVDLLDGKLEPHRITGFVVNQAHKVSDTSTEAFIVRIYRWVRG